MYLDTFSGRHISIVNVINFTMLFLLTPSTINYLGTNENLNTTKHQEDLFSLAVLSVQYQCRFRALFRTIALMNWWCSTTVSVQYWPEATALRRSLLTCWPHCYIYDWRCRSYWCFVQQKCLKCQQTYAIFLSFILVYDTGAVIQDRTIGHEPFQQQSHWIFFCFLQAVCN